MSTGKWGSRTLQDMPEWTRGLTPGRYFKWRSDSGEFWDLVDALEEERLEREERIKKTIELLPPGAIDDLRSGMDRVEFCKLHNIEPLAVDIIVKSIAARAIRAQRNEERIEGE